MGFLNEILIAAGVMTGTTVITSGWVSCLDFQQLSFQAQWTGTPTGAFSFEVTNDLDPAVKTVAGATVLTPPASFSAGNPAGALGSFGFEFSPLPYRWVRIKYTNASGAGSLNVALCGWGSN